MTAWRDIEPLVRLPPLAETPVVARLAVALVWLAIGLLGGPLTCLVLLVAAVAVLVAASGYTTAALLRASWRPLVLVAVAGVAAFALSINDGRPHATEVAILVVERLLLLLAVALLVVLPQDAESAVSEAIVLLHVPARTAYGALVLARVVSAIPADIAAYRSFRRARDMRRRGLLGALIEPLTALPYVVRAARGRFRALRSAAELSALGSGSQRTVYRSVSFGRNGRYVIVGGLIVAVVSLLIALL
jgi:hypothetical protein